MKLLSYSHRGRASFGAVVDAGVIDLGARLAGRADSLRAALTTVSMDELRLLIEQVTKADFGLSEIIYLPTIPNPDKIICIGVNYAERNAEYKDASDLPKYPSVFLRTTGSLVGHNTPVLRPPESDQFDYEGEIAIIIGRAGRRITESNAHQHIAGLSVMNEGTVRDWLRHGKFNVTQGKNFTASGSLGPWLVTTDEFPDVCGPRSLQTHVNGELRQDDNTARLMFPFRRLVAYLSTFMVLLPGDVIATGTPTGAGFHLTPPRFLVPGDTVSVHVEHVGTLSNQVLDEPRTT
jgi:5-carboxymethyl-2-hydroxymuconate isomerase